MVKHMSSMKQTIDLRDTSSQDSSPKARLVNPFMNQEMSPEAFTETQQIHENKTRENEF